MKKYAPFAFAALVAAFHSTQPATANAEPGRATDVPDCTVFVDASAAGGDGSVAKPHKTIGAAVKAADPGAVICVAEGTYAEQLTPGEKHITLAGGFQRGQAFKVRDSAAYISKAKGKGGSFFLVKDTGPVNQTTVIDGFEITGYAQAIVRDYYEPQVFEITNNNIHDNHCNNNEIVGAGFALLNVSGTIKNNIIRKNTCGRGGAGFVNDAINKNSVTIDGNLVDANAGIEPGGSHGGALYLFGNTLTVTNNVIINNSVTQWGAGLYIGAYRPGNQPTTATMSGNVYRGNKAGNSGGGFFCDDGATCIASNELYDSNCGGNILVDGGADGSGPTKSTFDHITNVRSLDTDCKTPGIGLFVSTWEGFAADTYAVTNSVFWGNAPGKDFATICGSGCKNIKVAVSQTMADTSYADGNIKITFGSGMIAPADPLFAAPDNGDFRMQDSSPAAGKGANVDGSAAGPAVAVSTENEPPEAASEPASPSEQEPAAEAEQPAEPQQAASSAPSRDGDVSAKQAFDDAKELGTVEAWNAFLESYPTGFHANLARAYLKKLGAEPATPSPSAAPAADVAPAPVAGDTTVPVAAAPAVSRSGKFMGFAEQFNRYYTDPDWKPSRTLYVSPEGGGDGSTRDSPLSANDAVAQSRPGTLIHFTPGTYDACYEFTKDTGGTYDEPVVVYGERGKNQSLAVTINCCTTKRHTCFNLEGADYVAIDGFKLASGKYGVRAIGVGYAASEHSRGVAVLNNTGHDQDRDPFFSGQADWAVWENNLAYGAKEGDGHGIYLSNGGDWNIVRFNETHSNQSSDFQINADPASTCKDVGIAYDDSRCDAYAGDGEGGQGASDYFLVEGNWFHRSSVGPNFTSVRRSVVRNNIFGPQTRHNVSFWQETDNPKLGSSDNKVLHNLFITTGRHGVKFENYSTRNEFANNVLLGLSIDGSDVSENPEALLLEADGTVGENVYRSNLYASGKFEGHSPGGDETALGNFSASWFKAFPTKPGHNVSGFTPTGDAPFLGIGTLNKNAPQDRNGTARSGTVDLGPIEVE